MLLERNETSEDRILFLQNSMTGQGVDLSHMLSKLINVQYSSHFVVRSFVNAKVNRQSFERLN